MRLAPFELFSDGLRLDGVELRIPQCGRVMGRPRVSLEGAVNGAEINLDRVGFAGDVDEHLGRRGVGEARRHRGPAPSSPGALMIASKRVRQL